MVANDANVTPWTTEVQRGSEVMVASAKINTLNSMASNMHQVRTIDLQYGRELLEF
jgi:hypothetical protein